MIKIAGNLLNHKSSFFLLSLLALLIGAGTISAETTSTAGAVAGAEYRINFDASWNAANHPTDYPEASDHWSTLVGTTHNNSFTLWESGEMATTGIKNVAESGANTALKNEVDTATGAHQWLQANFSPNVGDGFATMVITTTSDFPLLSLATMVAPSPDWFAGVSNLSLLDGNGLWKSSIEMALYPYDAGTDSGTTYIFANTPTTPAENITLLTGVSPFSTAPVGTLTVTLLNTPTAVGLTSSGAGQANSGELIVVATLGLLVLTVARSGAGIPRKVE